MSVSNTTRYEVWGREQGSRERELLHSFRHKETAVEFKANLEESGAECVTIHEVETKAVQP